MTEPEHVAHPPLAGLEAVRVVARFGSLTSAAGALRLTASALSRRVAATEAWLGTPLFERHGRGMRPTPDGHRFLARVDEAFALIESAADSWRGRRGPDVVRLSVLPSFARFWLLDRLTSLERGNGAEARLRIELVMEHRNTDVEAGEADIAIRYGRGRWRGLDARPLMIESLVPVASPELAAQLGREPSLAAMLALPLLYDSDATAWRAWLKHAGVEQFRPRSHDRRFEDYGLVLAAAKAGLGITLARLPLVEETIAALGLVRLSAIEVPSPLRHYIVTRTGDTRSAVITLVHRIMAQLASDAIAPL